MVMLAGVPAILVGPARVARALGVLVYHSPDLEFDAGMTRGFFTAHRFPKH